MHNCYPSARGTQGADETHALSSRSSVNSAQSNNNNVDGFLTQAPGMADLIRCKAKYSTIEWHKYQTTMSRHPETPPPSPPNEQQTEAKIEYTDASTIRVNKDRLYKRRPASTELDDTPVPPVEFREPVDVITKAPCKRNSSLDGHELESWNWDRVSCGTGIFMWEREWEYYIPQEEKRFFKKRLITSAMDDVDAIGCPAHELDERSTGESDAHSAGTASAKSTHGLIDKKFDDGEPQGALYNMMIGCCTCLGFFCFT